MNIADTLFKHYASDPRQLGEKILQTLDGKPAELRVAARRWCGLVASLSDAQLDGLRDVYRLLHLAGEGNALFVEFLAKAERSPHRQVLVRGMLILYEHRAQPAIWSRLLIDWARQVQEGEESLARVPMMVAQAFCEYPDLAYEVIAEKIESRWLGPIEASPRLAAASVALTRRLQDQAEQPSDRRALAGPTGDEYFEHFRSQLRALLRGRKAIPGDVWAVVDRHLSVNPGSDVNWYEALWLKAASLEHQDAAVELLAGHVQRAANPALWFEVSSGLHLGHMGLFTGPGWGRDGLGKKLLPIARVFVRRRQWPTKSWLCCFTTLVSGRERSIEEQVQSHYDRVKDVLGEALLERALDPAEDLATRSHAVRALGSLSPTGQSSTIRALGKLHSHPDLGPISKAAQKQSRDRVRQTHLDAELTLLDAWTLFAE